MNKPVTTLFMISSLDGKISTGDNDAMDVDKDFPKIQGIKEGLHQYYYLEKLTDRVSMNSGLVQAKIGVNERDVSAVKKDDISFVLVDNKPWLTTNGCTYFAKRSEIFYLITTNNNHPAFALQEQYDNIRILLYKGDIDFIDVFRQFKEEYNIERVTIQTGGTLNAKLLRLGLIDYVSLVIAPCLIGGADTPSLIDGESLRTTKDLINIKTLKLLRINQLDHSYLHVQYEVHNSIL